MPLSTQSDDDSASCSPTSTTFTDNIRGSSYRSASPATEVSHSDLDPNDSSLSEGEGDSEDDTPPSTPVAQGQCSEAMQYHSIIVRDALDVPYTTLIAQLADTANRSLVRGLGAEAVSSEEGHEHDVNVVIPLGREKTLEGELAWESSAMIADLPRMVEDEMGIPWIVCPESLVTKAELHLNFADPGVKVDRLAWELGTKTDQSSNHETVTQILRRIALAEFSDEDIWTKTGRLTGTAATVFDLGEYPCMSKAPGSSEWEDCTCQARLQVERKVKIEDYRERDMERKARFGQNYMRETYSDQVEEGFKRLLTPDVDADTEEADLEIGSEANFKSSPDETTRRDEGRERLPSKQEYLGRRRS